MTSLKLTVENNTCVHCHRCNEHCPMSLPVEAMVESRNMEHSECILCGSCADSCNEKIMSLGFR